MTLDGRIAVAFQNVESMNAGEAFTMAQDILEQAPNDHRALFLMGYVMLKSEHAGAAYTFYRRAADIEPNDHRIWNNLAKACQELFLYDEAGRHLERALELNPRNPAALQNLAVTKLNLGEPEKVFELAEAAERLDPRIKAYSRDAMAQANFSLGRWGLGWEDFHHTLGNKYRKRKTYPGDREWAGPLEPTDGPVVIYGEQGIGDEIFLANLLRPLKSAGLDIHLDCDARLEGLFRRSFPWLSVHGTRRVAQPDWLMPDQAYLAAPMAAVGMWTCQTDEDWNRTPYLTPCPFRKFQWQSLFLKGGRTPVIGIAWTGGAPKTGEADKSMGIATLGPLFEAFPNAQFVSLEHKPGRVAVVGRYANENRKHIAHFPWATEAQDYDGTAAIVAACDVVVSVMTSVAHTAAALGVPTWMMLPVRPQPAWRYHGRGPEVPYYGCMRLVRQRTAREWAPVVEEVVGELRSHFARTKAAA